MNSEYELGVKLQRRPKEASNSKKDRFPRVGEPSFLLTMRFCFQRCSATGLMNVFLSNIE
jgi:hypothetical protein